MGVVALAELVHLMVKDLRLDAVGPAVQLGIFGPVMAARAVFGLDALAHQAAGNGIQLLNGIAAVAGDIHRVKALLGLLHHAQRQRDQVIDIDIIAALVAVRVELRRAVIVQLADHVAHKRRLLAQAVDVGAVDIGKAQAGHGHAVGVGKALGKPLAAVFCVGVDQRRRVELRLHGRELGLVLIHGVGGGLHQLPDAGAAARLQQVHKAQRIDLDGLHRVALAVRQGGDTCDVVHDLELFFLKQLEHPGLVADIHLPHLSTEIMVVKLQIVHVAVGKVVDTHDLIAALPQLVPELTADKPGCTRYQNLHCKNLLTGWTLRPRSCNPQ